MSDSFQLGECLIVTLMATRVYFFFHLVSSGGKYDRRKKVRKNEQGEGSKWTFVGSCKKNSIGMYHRGSYLPSSSNVLDLREHRICGTPRRQTPRCLEESEIKI